MNSCLLDSCHNTNSHLTAERAAVYMDSDHNTNNHLTAERTADYSIPVTNRITI